MKIWSSLLLHPPEVEVVVLQQILFRQLGTRQNINAVAVTTNRVRVKTLVTIIVIFVVVVAVAVIVVVLQGGEEVLEVGEFEKGPEHGDGLGPPRCLLLLAVLSGQGADCGGGSQMFGGRGGTLRRVM